MRILVFGKQGAKFGAPLALDERACDVDSFALLACKFLQAPG